MRVGLRILGLLLLIPGVVFFFQGIGVIPGSFMTGRSEWVVIGAALAAAGLTLLWLAGVSGTRTRL